MTHRCLFGAEVASLLFALICTTPATRSQAADVVNYEIAKNQFFHQSSDTAIEPDGEFPIDFDAYVEASAPGALLSATLQLPSGAIRTLNRDVNDLAFYEGFRSLDALHAAYPAGRYVFTLVTANDGLVTASLDMPAGGPLPPIRISNYTAAQAIDPANAFDLVWTPPAGARADDYISVVVIDPQTHVEILESPQHGSAGALNGASRSFRIPAGTLTSGRSYWVDIELYRINQINSSSYPEAPGYSLFSTTTYLDIRAGNEPAAGGRVFSSLVKQRHFVQSSATAAPQLLGAAAFQLQADVSPSAAGVVSSAALRLPSAASRNLIKDSFSPDFELEELFDTAAALNSAHPAGSYAFIIATAAQGTKTLALTLPADNYPNAPRVSNYAAAQTINPELPFVLTWDPFVGGQAEDFIEVEIELASNGQTVFDSPNYGVPGALNGLSTALGVAPGALAPNQSYVAKIGFYRLVSLDTNSVPGFVTAVAFSSLTKVALRTAAPGEPLNITTTSLPEGRVGQPYSAVLAATGGTPPYVWSVAQGNLPAGITLAAAGGALAGVPTAPGTAAFTIRVADAAQRTATVPLELRVAAGPAVLAPDLFFYGIEKRRRFTQTGNAAPLPAAGAAFQFSAMVGLLDPLALRQASVQGPDGRTTLLRALPDDFLWFVEELYANQAALDSVRPSGTYTTVLDLPAAAQERLTLPVPANDFPPTPQFTNVENAQSVNPFAALTLNWQPFPSPRQNDFVELQIEDVATGEILFSLDDSEDIQPGVETRLTSVTLPPGTLEPAERYIARLLFFRAAHIDETAHPDATGFVAFTSATTLSISTTDVFDPGPGATAGTIVLRSDGQTLAAPVENLAALDAGNTVGAVFSPASDRPLNSTAQLPPNAPVGTKVVNIAPGGQSGFYRVAFLLPVNAVNVRLAGVANFDDVGRVFLNGNPLTPSLSGSVPGQLRPSANAAFSSQTASHFRLGPFGFNELLFANHNPSGGGSGGAFFASVAFDLAETIDLTGAPVLFSDPVSMTVENGDEAFLEVLVLGAEPLSYQWRFNGADIPGETEDFLYLPEVSARDIGAYSVVVRNAFGTVISRPAILSVLVPPTITLQPRGATVAQGDTVTLTVQASGDGPLAYQWLRNGDIVPGATAATLTLQNIQPADSGAYSVVVEGLFDAEESEIARVVVQLDPLTLANNFADRIRLSEISGSGRGSNAGATREAGEPAHAGEAAKASVWAAWIAPASGTATINTRGSAIDTVLAVYTGASLPTLTPVASDDDSGGFFTSSVRFNAVAGQEYAVAIDGFDGEQGDIVLSYALNPGANPIPVISQHPRSLVVNAGATATFSVTASLPPAGAGSLSYQWLRNGQAVPNATAASLTLPSVQTPVLGAYSVRVSNGPDAIESRPAFLEINVPRPGTAVGEARSEDKFARSTGTAAAPLGLNSFVGKRPRPSGGLASGYSGTQIFSTFGSTTELGEPNHCGVIGGASQWFSYLAEASGTLTITTDGSDFDTVLGVYTGPGDSFATLRQVACDNNSGADGRDSLVRLAVTGGTVYYIAVDGVGGQSGNVKLSYNLAASARFTIAPQTAGSFQFTFSGQPGTRYTISRSSDLITWSSLLVTNLPGSGVITVTDPAPPGPARRFYRARSN